MTRIELDDILTASRFAAPSNIKEVLFGIKNRLETATACTITPRECKELFPDYRFMNRKSIELEFLAPKTVSVVGSLLSDCMCTPPSESTANVDMFILMPNQCFVKEDLVKFRYHDKRVLYMTALARALEGESFHVEYFAGSDLRKPVLIVTKKLFRVRLLVGFSQTHKKLRLNLFLPHVEKTPYTNASIAEDARLVPHAEMLHHFIVGNPIFRDAVILIKRWLQCTDLSGEFTGFLASMLCCYLQHTERFTGAQDALSMMRVFLTFLADPTSFKDGIFWPTESADESRVPDAVKQSFCAAFDVVFVDSSGVLNLANRLTLGTLSLVRSEAATALKQIKTNSLSLIFSSHSEFWLRWDCLVEVSRNLTLTDELRSALVGKRQDFERYFGWRALAATCFLDVLRRGFAGRSEAMAAHTTKDGRLLLGVRLNALTAFRQLDAGPPATAKAEALLFREFWGEKAQLRRFRDGSIIESVVWDVPFENQNQIPELIVRHLLKHHFSVEPKCVWGTQLEVAVPRKGELESLRILNIFNDLSQKLRMLENVPLAVNDVWGLDATLRTCNVFPPEESVAAAGRSLVEGKRTSLSLNVVNFCVRYIDSTSWPDQAAARNHLKGAFRLKTREELARMYQISSVLQSDCLDILYQGYVFRMRVTVGNDPIEPRQAIKAEAGHASALLGFQMKHNSFGQTVRLAVRWLDSHLLSDKYSQETVELTVVAVFCEAVPASPMFGFLRWLRLMATHEWKNEPLFVSINGDPLSDIVMSSSRQLMESKQLMPCIVSDIDESSFWSRRSNPLAWNRASLLAQVACNVSMNAPLSVFVHNYSEYDFVIRLNHAAIPNYAQNIELHLNSQPRPKLPSHVPWTILSSKQHRLHDTSELLIGFDPVRQFVAELQLRLGVFCSFWFDANGGDCIGVVLKHSSRAPKSIVQMGCVRNDDFDQSLFTQYVKDVGADMVETVESNKKE